MVETAARRAFRERRASSPPARHVNLIFDSTRDELQRDGLPRVLLLSAAGFDAMLTVVVSARGAVVSGALMPKQGTRIGLRRPMLATIVLRVDSRGVISDTLVPCGPACVVVETVDGSIWESEWLTL